MARLVFCLIALALGGCTTTPEAPPAVPRVVTQTVKVPYPVFVGASQELQHCGSMLERVEVQAGVGDAFLVLTKENAEALKKDLDVLGRCIRAWRVWEMTQRVEAARGR